MPTFYYQLLIIIIVLLPSYLLRASVFGLPTNFLEILIIISIAIALSRPNIRRYWLSAWSSIPYQLKVSVLLLITAAFASALLALPSLRGFGYLKSFFIIPLALAFQIYAMIRQKPSTIRLIIASLTLSGVLIALIGLSQLGQLDRVKSLFDVPNSLALFLVPITVLACFSPPHLRGRLRGGEAIMIIAIIATQSLGALLSLFITILAGLLFFKRFTTYHRLFIVLLVISAALFLNHTGRLNYFLVSGPPTSLDVRYQLWSVSLDLIQDHPLLGVGLGQFEPAYQKKLHERFARNLSPLPEFVFRDPHSWPLSFWLNTGLLGLLAFAYLNYFLLKKAWPLAKTNLITQALVLSLLSILVHGLVDTIYWKNDLALLYWLIFALLLSMVPAVVVPPSDPSAPKRIVD